MFFAQPTQAQLEFYRANSYLSPAAARLIELFSTLGDKL